MSLITRMFAGLGGFIAALICPEFAAWRREGQALAPLADSPVHEGSGRAIIVLALDAADYAAIVRVMAERERWAGLSEGTSNRNGAVIAEICRGWSEITAPDVPHQPFTN